MQYFINTSKGEKGPFSAEQVAILAQQGKLRPDHVIRVGDDRAPIKVADVIAPKVADVIAPPSQPLASSQSTESSQSPVESEKPAPRNPSTQRRTRPGTARTTRSSKTVTKRVTKKPITSESEEAAEPPKGLIANIKWRFNSLPWWVRWPSVAGFLVVMLYITIGLEDSRIADAGEKYRKYAKDVIAKEATDPKKRDELFDLIDYYHEECLKESITSTRGYKSSTRRADEEAYFGHLIKKLDVQGGDPDQAVLNDMAWTIANKPGTNRLPTARGYAERAVEKARAANKKEWLARNLDTLAFVQWQMGERETAARTQAEAVSYSEALPADERSGLLDRQKKYQSL